MNNSNKRMNRMDAQPSAKRVRKECSYGAACYRMNPAHFREYSHPHLESILAAWSGGEYDIPAQYGLQRSLLTDQLDMLVKKKLYVAEPSAAAPQNATSVAQLRNSASSSNASQSEQVSSERVSRDSHRPPPNTQVTAVPSVTGEPRANSQNSVKLNNSVKSESVDRSEQSGSVKSSTKSDKLNAGSSKSDKLNAGGSKTDKLNAGSSKSDKLNAGSSKREKSVSPPPGLGARLRDPSYRPVVPPARRAEDYLAVVRPRGLTREKHAAAAPCHVFYTANTAERATHSQPYSITFLELLDASLGELQSSLQINFMVEPAWLLAQYYFAGYSAKKLTILYGEECDDMKQLATKPAVDAVRVQMTTPFGKHHTKMMLLCYEDGSLRVVVSTANLYQDDWDNRTQGLWLSPRCPLLPAGAPPHDGESPTQFKRGVLRYLAHYRLPNLEPYVERVKRCDFSDISPHCPPLPAGAPPHDGESPTQFKRGVLRYLAHYRLPNLEPYVERVKRCDFSDIRVFLVASVPGSHFDLEWGMARAGALLRQHCSIPAAEATAWPLVAQASSLGSYGPDPKLWLTGDFLQNFTKIKNPPQMLMQPPPLQLIYPSLENVRRSHDGLLGGGCLPYAADCHAKQPWLNAFLHQWVAEGTRRSRAMPHIKSYTRARGARAAFFLLTSANVSKAAWGSVNKGNRALRLLSYEAGVLLLPRAMIDADYFPLAEGAANRLVIPYDLPPTPYAPGMAPWVQDHLY